QDGAAEKQKLNSTPSRATRSKFGVLTTLSPYSGACGQPQSSARQNRMLGRASLASGGAACALPASAKPVRIPMTAAMRRQTGRGTMQFMTGLLYGDDD